MDEMKRIDVLENQMEAQILDQELDKRGIPHIIIDRHDSAYDGIFQTQGGWGEVCAPKEFEGDILEILKDLREITAGEA